MKKIFCWLFLSVFLCSTTMVTTSCGDDEVEDFIETINLVGTWKQLSHSITPDLPNPELVTFSENDIVTFNADYTYIVNNGEGKGTWSLKNKILSCKYKEDGKEEEESFLVESYDRNQLVISTKEQMPTDGNTYKITYTFARVK